MYPYKDKLLVLTRDMYIYVGLILAFRKIGLHYIAPDPRPFVAMDNKFTNFKYAVNLDGRVFDLLRGALRFLSIIHSVSPLNLGFFHHLCLTTSNRLLDQGHASKKR